MGTDIHGWAEWKWTNSTARNPWMGIAPLPNIRSYPVFAVLADIRNEGDFDSYADRIPLRGTPDPISPELAQSSDWSYHLEDLHSCTWYTLEEIVRDITLFDQIEYAPVRRLWTSYLDYLLIWQRNHSCDIRLVMGFDS